MKGRFGWTYIYAEDRLKQPMVRTGNTWQPISWDAALDRVADEFTRIKTEFGPDALAAISSSRGTNEENYLFGKFIRCVMGTNHIDNCARVCHSATVTGMMETLVASAATNSMLDLDQAKLIMVVGANPTESHPVVGARIKQAHWRGVPLIVIDPRKTELARLATAIRKRMNAILDSESAQGPIRRLHADFRKTLIHDLSEDDFADVVAQTISYGLLAARFSRPMGISVHDLPRMVPPTNPFLRELLEMFLEATGHTKTLNFDELGIQDVVEVLNRAQADAVKADFGNRTRSEDPVVHFYEHFLKAYDARRKVQRGVFYTPQPVVSYIVRSVHELLQTEFGLEDGLASTVTWGEMKARHKGLTLSLIHISEPTRPY